MLNTLKDMSKELKNEKNKGILTVFIIAIIAVIFAIPYFWFYFIKIANHIIQETLANSSMTPILWFKLFGFAIVCKLFTSSPSKKN